MKLSKAAKTYLKDVRKKLPIMDSSARKMLRELKTSVAEFSAERPKANIEDFEKGSVRHTTYLKATYRSSAITT